MGGPGSGRRPGGGKMSKGVRPGTEGMGRKSVSFNQSKRIYHSIYGKSGGFKPGKINIGVKSKASSKAARGNLRGRGRGSRK